MSADERSPLLAGQTGQDRRLSRLIQQDEEAASVVKSHVTAEEQAMADSTVGERLQYNDYTTIDWLHDLVGSVHFVPSFPFLGLSHNGRSKIHIDIVSYTLARALVTKPWPSLTPHLVGSPQQSLAR